MLDFEEIKRDADALGMSYRSDIKPETLLKRIQTRTPAEVVAEVVVSDTILTFKNTSTVNVFTSKGRCAPNATVVLTESESLTHKGLELCQKKALLERMAQP